jgi:hypothetical protein
MMNDSRPDGQARAEAAGLCDRCRHVHVIENARGSRFYLCRKSFTDPGFPRYPPLPVLCCAGFSPAGAPDPSGG